MGGRMDYDDSFMFDGFPAFYKNKEATVSDRLFI